MLQYSATLVTTFNGWGRAFEWRVLDRLYSWLQPTWWRSTDSNRECLPRGTGFTVRCSTRHSCKTSKNLLRDAWEFYRSFKNTPRGDSPKILVRVENFEISTLWLKARYSASELHPHNTICLVLSRYRVWTHTLFGPNRPGTGPDITASALERKHLTPKFAR